MQPRMVVIAGPPGGRKSTAFPVSSFGIDCFNADDRAAALNQGSYRSIPPSIRGRVNQEFERFIAEHIRDGRSFALETTLRSQVTFEQARSARENGFSVVMRYVALKTAEQHLERIALRAQAGGHAASEATLRAIHRASLSNLPQAFRDLDHVAVFDNSRFAEAPEYLMATRAGRVVHLVDETPSWLDNALLRTEWEITKLLREQAERQR